MWTQKESDVAVPKRKMSRSNTRARRSQWKAAPITLTKCDRCGSAKRPHTACATCGTYNKRSVLDV
jgi:large subunit ribosomal protein L32